MSDYGKKVKIALINKDMQQKDLMEQVENKTGLKVDSSYMYKIMNGSRKPKKIICAINEILGISE